MANKLITCEEAAKGMLADIQRLPAAYQNLALYSLQIGMGGFPRDLEREKALYAACDEPDAKQQMIALYGNDDD